VVGRAVYDCWLNVKITLSLASPTFPVTATFATEIAVVPQPNNPERTSFAGAVQLMLAGNNCATKTLVGVSKAQLPPTFTVAVALLLPEPDVPTRVTVYTPLAGNDVIPPMLVVPELEFEHVGPVAPPPKSVQLVADAPEPPKLRVVVTKAVPLPTIASPRTFPGAWTRTGVVGKARPPDWGEMNQTSGGEVGSSWLRAIAFVETVLLSSDANELGSTPPGQSMAAMQIELEVPSESEVTFCINWMPPPDPRTVVLNCVT
jgi:hypothetical protein